MYRILMALALALQFAAAPAGAQALDGRLKKIADAKTIAVAYRPDAIPFSYIDDSKQIAGFSIDVCKRVVNSIGRQINVPDLQIRWVPVTTQTRFDAVAKGQADMECGSSTVTLARLKQVDFSSFIFLESTGLLVKAGGSVRSFSDLAGRRIGVVAGTTNEQAVKAQLARRQISSTVVPFKTREEAATALEDGKVDAFASDKLLLVGAAVKARDPKALAILPDELSFEPYGLVLPRGDAGLRLAVNTGLSQLYGSGEIREIFGRWFSQFGRPSPMVEAVYVFGAIPE